MSLQVGHSVPFHLFYPNVWLSSGAYIIKPLVVGKEENPHSFYVSCLQQDLIKLKDWS